jgi:hypothetical protein
MQRNLIFVMGLSALTFSACGDDTSTGGQGKVRVLLTAEETITEGLDQGSDVENTRDYSVRFSKYLATIGNVRMARASGADEVTLAQQFVADMTQLGQAGIELGVFEALDAGEWARFGFETPAAKSGAKALAGVSADDLEKMVDNGWTYWIEGVVERDAASGGPVEFVVQAEVATTFSECELDGEPGVTVVADGTATATITLHGDHLFFNAFPTGTEGTIERLAGWVIAADADGDGQVSTADLAALDATDVFKRDLGYSLDGAPIAIESALDFARAQLATQGHYKGEGECVWEFEGVEAEHDHADE